MKRKIIIALVAIMLLIFASCSAPPSNSGSPSNPPPPQNLSGDTSFTLTSVAGKTVLDGEIIISSTEWSEFEFITDYKAVSNYLLADKATLTVTRNDKSLVFVVVAEDGTQAVKTVNIKVLSSDTAILVSKIAGFVVEDGAITLTSAQFNQLKTETDLKSKSEYSLSIGATVQVSLVGNTVNFTVTAEDGTSKTSSVNVIVLSSEASITLTSLNGIEPIDGVVTMTQDELCAWEDEGDYLSSCAFTSSEGSTVTASFDDNSRRLTLTCVSEDGLAEDSTSVMVVVAMPFGSHTVTQEGSKENVTYDYDKDVYAINGAVVVTDYDGNVLKNNWSFSADFTFSNMQTDSEFKISSVSLANTFIRYVLRVESATPTYRMFTDYKDNDTTFRHPMTCVEERPYKEGDFVRLGVINKGNSVVVTFDGRTVYRRTLASQSAPECLLSYLNLTALMKNIEIETGAETVELAYQSALNGYKEVGAGLSATGSGTNLDKFITNDDGSVSVYSKDVFDDSTRSGRVMGNLYYEGTPIGGYRFIAYTRLKIINASKGAQSGKLEMQLYSSGTNYFRFYIWRHPNNHRIRWAGQINGESHNAVDIKAHYLTHCEATEEYVLDFAMVYDGKTAQIWLKEIKAGEKTTGLNVSKWTKEYEFDANWDWSNLTVAVNQHMDVTFADTKAYYGTDYDDFLYKLNAEAGTTTKSDFSLSANAEKYEESDVFSKTKLNSFVKQSHGYGSAYLFDGGKVVTGNYLLLAGNVLLSPQENWAQAELKIELDSTHAVRYVLEYTTGNYQIFSEYKNGTTAWKGWSAVLAPTSSNKAYVDFAIVNNNGVLSFLADGYVLNTSKVHDYKGAKISFGGKGCTSIWYNLTLEKNEDTVRSFAENMKEPSYVSPYEADIKKLETKYATAQKGGVIFLGSSIMTNWKTFATDLDLVDGVTGYNVGFGGAIAEDCPYSFDRLVKPLNPSKIFVFVGGNNVGAKGQKGEETVQKIAAYLEMVRKELPNAKLYYIYTLPTPGACKDGKYYGEYGNLVYGMIEYCEKNSDWVTGISVHSALTDETGNMKSEYLLSDKVHLTDLGYQKFSSVIYPYVHDGLEKA